MKKKDKGVDKSVKAAKAKEVKCGWSCEDMGTHMCKTGACPHARLKL